MPTRRKVRASLIGLMGSLHKIDNVRRNLEQRDFLPRPPRTKQSARSRAPPSRPTQHVRPARCLHARAPAACLPDSAAGHPVVRLLPAPRARTHGLLAPCGTLHFCPHCCERAATVSGLDSAWTGLPRSPARSRRGRLARARAHTGHAGTRGSGHHLHGRARPARPLCPPARTHAPPPARPNAAHARPHARTPARPNARTHARTHARTCSSSVPCTRPERSGRALSADL